MTDSTYSIEVVRVELLTSFIPSSNVLPVSTQQAVKFLLTNSGVLREATCLPRRWVFNLLKSLSLSQAEYGVEPVARR